ncbi:hypothetical protein ACIBIZ_41125 [Nonomuraea spiralis]|uniref:hypothetical protein n=1 Tax=Nonomuraea spiralis TaxID=46182 RepID=UPI0037A37B31
MVGSGALLVHLVAQPVDRVDHDLLALQTMVRQGFFLSDETPYKGVSALRPSSRITVRDGVRTITGTPLPEAAPAPATGRAKRARPSASRRTRCWPPSRRCAAWTSR